MIRTATLPCILRQSDEKGGSRPLGRFIDQDQAAESVDNPVHHGQTKSESAFASGVERLEYPLSQGAVYSRPVIVKIKPMVLPAVELLPDRRLDMSCGGSITIVDVRRPFGPSTCAALIIRLKKTWDNEALCPSTRIVESSAEIFTLTSSRQSGW